MTKSGLVIYRKSWIARFRISKAFYALSLFSAACRCISDGSTFDTTGKRLCWCRLHCSQYSPQGFFQLGIDNTCVNTFNPGISILQHSEWHLFSELIHSLLCLFPRAYVFRMAPILFRWCLYVRRRFRVLRHRIKLQ